MQNAVRKLYEVPPVAKIAQYDAVVVGAGFAGLYALYRLTKLGLSVRVIDAGRDIGGTWHWNRYPGARCDVESFEYQFGFSEEILQGWNWTERYASQPEIIRYMNYVADKLDLRRDIQLDTRVTSATYVSGASSWDIRTERGERIMARYCILATGSLSSVRVPDFDGLESFEGEWFHTGHWPSGGVDFRGKRVGVIGTGSSGIQIIPTIAKQASQLVVFQRTANFCVPAFNTAIPYYRSEEMKSRFAEDRSAAKQSSNGLKIPMGHKKTFDVSPEEQVLEYERRWKMGGFAVLTAFTDLMTDAKANEVAAEFVRSKIRSIVKDPKTASILCPKGHPLGAKRICVGINYFETFNEPHVTLVDLQATPIERINAKGIDIAGRSFPLDNIVFATGFDAITGSILNIDIRGRDGLLLREKWGSGPRTYLGVGVANFPNLFFVAGPGSPSVLGNAIISIEQHVEWIANCITYMREKGISAIEVDEHAEEHWTSHVRDSANQTLYPRADSWFTGANIPGKPRTFMPYVGGIGRYRQICDDVSTNGYRGFFFSS